MAGQPWWVERVSDLPARTQLSELTLGELWRLRERIQFIRENVELARLPEDFERVPDARALWSALELLEPQALNALEERAATLASRLRSGELRPSAFRCVWEQLGFATHAEDSGTPADDFLDGAFNVSRLTTGESRPAFGMPNMSSRAHRLADFLASTRPCEDDVVFDLGSGNGKVALTVAASTPAQVCGVEIGESYVAAARRSAAFLGLGNVRFVQADVREVDLSRGSIFYLYYPFHGSVARDVAVALGTLARARPITVYSAGPLNDFGEHFLAQVDDGALTLTDRRGEFGEALVLRSAQSGGDGRCDS
jgi:hypothetical protein